MLSHRFPASSQLAPDLIRDFTHQDTRPSRVNDLTAWIADRERMGDGGAARRSLQALAYVQHHELPVPAARVRPLHAVVGDLPTLAHPDDYAKVQASRRVAYELQAVAATLKRSERVALCQRLPQSTVVDVRLNPQGRAFVGGVQTCGSVWMCSVCAKKITEARRADLQHLAEFVRAGGGSLLFLTLTVPHRRRDALAGLLQNLKGAYRYLVSGKNALPKLFDGSYLGAVRALEVTHGENGWHPHIHVVVALGEQLDADQLADLEGRIFRRWEMACKKHELGQISFAGFKLEAARVSGLDRDPLTDYLAKWGLAEELSKLHTKTGKSGSTPWQLLALARDGDDQAAAVWQEYATEFKGARQLVWSHGLRQLVGLVEEWTDEAVAAAEEPDSIILRVLTPDEWRAVRARSTVPAMLEAAEVSPAALFAFISDCLSKSSQALVKDNFV